MIFAALTCVPISPRVLTVVCCLFLFFLIWTIAFAFLRKNHHYYFDAQDFLHFEKGQGRRLPVSAEAGTFAPLLKGYVGATKLLITVAAASIAFGNDRLTNTGIFLAKLVLSCSVLYGTLFVAFLQYFYEIYAQDVESYKPWKFSLIHALGFSALICFVLGYLVWAFNLG